MVKKDKKKKKATSTSNQTAPQPTNDETIEVQNRVTETHTPLCVLFRHSAAMFLDGLDPYQIAKIAVINKAHYLWIKQYFDENVGCLNIFVNGNKFCVSRKPCDLSNYSCTHRLVRNIDNFNLLINMGLVTIRSVYIQSHAKPTCKPLSMHAVRKLLAPLCQVSYVYIDVNHERPYVEPIEQLLERNVDTIQGFYVCRLNEDNSEFNFLRFLNLTRFGKTDFPLHSFVKTKKKNKKKAAPAGAHQLPNNLNMNEIQEFVNEIMNFD